LGERKKNRVVQRIPGTVEPTALEGVCIPRSFFA
jgi:hypothetical protein